MRNPKKALDKFRPSSVEEKIEKDRVIIDGYGQFPKSVVFILDGEEIVYRMVKTRNNKFQMS